MKVLIIGLGSISKKHIEAVRFVDDKTQFYALRRNENCEQLEGIQNIFNISDFNSDELDFIIISNPTATHYETIKILLPLQIPLFIEKPLFNTVNTQTKQLVNSVTTSGMVSYVACNLRFLESIIKLKELLLIEKINEVNVYCGSYLPDWRPNVDFRRVYSANKEMGGGVHIDLIHELDYVFWLFGKPRSTQSFFSNNSSLEISAIDYAHYHWQYNEFSATIVLNYYRKVPKRNIEVLTEKGVYEVNLLENKIYFNNELIFESKQKIKDTYINQMNYFINNILKGKEIFNTIKEANDILELCIQD